eukprot:7794433-Alexandrium_andersonii.AAC.1
MAPGTPGCGRPDHGPQLDRSPTKLCRALGASRRARRGHSVARALSCHRGDTRKRKRLRDRRPR